jgi:hypothetical protein
MEGEYWLLSSGSDGRMADGGEVDYSEFMNEWNEVINTITG